MTEKTNDESALRQAILNGATDDISRLINGGANINAKDEKGWTALHFAAQVRRVDIALMLVKAGAQLDSRADGGRTALRIAIDRYGEGSAIALFLLGANKRRAEEMLAQLG